MLRKILQVLFIMSVFIGNVTTLFAKDVTDGPDKGKTGSGGGNICEC